MSCASLEYNFFTPYYRGFDLVFDFLWQRADRRFELGPWSIQASIGYEQARQTKVCAEDRWVGSARDLDDRFAVLAPAYQQFMCALETAATEWQEAERSAEEAADLRRHQEDEALCERVLAASKALMGRFRHAP